VELASEKLGVHPVVRLNFFVRLVGCPISVSIAILARMGAGIGMPMLLWLAFAAYALVWPFVNLLLARQMEDQKRHEHRAMLFDALISGAVIASSHFQIFPMVVIAAAFCSVLVSVGGLRLLLWGVLALTTGALATGSLLTDFAVSDATSTLTTASSAVLLVLFQVFLGFQTWRTARKFIRSRRQVREQSEEISAQNEALMQAREEALQAAKAKSVFLATMSHEIRTPLNGVLGMTRMLEETKLNDEQRDFLHTIQVSGNTLLTVINDVLDFSRIESGKIELEDQPYELRAVIEESLEIVAERARENRVELICDESADIPDTVLGDVTRMRQALTNLVGNAVKFTENGEVLVSVQRIPVEGGDEIEISVKDSGIGIPADRIDQLFVPFTQADASTTRRFGGTGLGLAITRNIIEQMGGRISVSSEVGVGTRFELRLPLRVADGGEHEATVIPGRPQDRRILVVDDNETNRRVLAAQLERWGFQVLCADGASQALALLEAEGSPDLAILDLHMPDVDGVMLAQQIRERSASAALPLLLLSSSMLQEDEASQGLFSAKLMKPARQSRLFDATMEALRMAPKRAASPTAELDRMADRMPLKILVADDNEINRKVASLAFRRYGYEVELAKDGREALDRVRGRALGHTAGEVFDVVFMDVHMPNMDGLEATRQIRRSADENPHRRWPRIVAITADAMQEERENCLSNGMDDYLTKPLDFDDLARVLRETAAEVAPEDGVSPAATSEPEGKDVAVASAVMDWSRLDELSEYDLPDGSIVRDAIQAFTENMPATLVAVRSALADGDLESGRQAAHALRGSAANIGAVGIATIATDMEAACKAGDGSIAGSMLEALEVTIDTTLAELSQRS
jgi:signal transduction histidine kinase/DNA-binding response OmpR family regulator